MSEYDQQCAVVKWFKLQYPEYAKCIISIPNGSHLFGTKEQRAKKINKMKREGMKLGVSDIFIAVPFRGKGGLWLEMKDEGKAASSLRKNQKEHLDLMRSVGYAAHWAAGFEQAKKIISDYMMPDIQICINCHREFKKRRCEHCYG